DYKDLQAAIGDEPLEVAVTKPEQEQKIKHEVLDILYDTDLLRDRSRRILGRACWFWSNGRSFIGLRPIEEVEAEYRSHQEWLDHAEHIYGGVAAGNENCFKMLRYPPSSTD